MANAIYTKPAPFGAISTFRFVNALEGVKNTFVEWNTNRHTRIELNKLTDRELTDIGLIRGDLDKLTRTYTGF